MYFVRNYSAKTTKKAYHGLKLIDYMRGLSGKSKMSAISSPGFTLNRNLANAMNPDPQDAELEKTTVIGAQLKVFDRFGYGPKTYKHLKSLLDRGGDVDLDQERQDFVNWKNGSISQSDSHIGRVLAKYDIELGDFEAWIACFEAPTLLDAINAMKGRSWPSFLLMFTLNRAAKSKTEAYEAIRIYETYMHTLNPKHQAIFTYQALLVALEHVIEMIPPICNIFVRHAHTQAKSAENINELLWNISSFGRSWSADDSLVLLAGQRVLVDFIGPEQLDLKGVCSIAYTLHFKDPTTALALIETQSESDKKEFAYQHGVWAIRLLTTKDVTEALKLFNSLDEQSQKKSYTWNLLLTSLRNKGQLTSSLAEKFLQAWYMNGVTMNTLMILRITEAVDSVSRRKAIMDEARSAGIEVDVLNYALVSRLNSREQYQEALTIIEQHDQSKIPPPVLVPLLRAQAKWEPEAVWGTYQQLLAAQAEPTVDALAALCQAAWSPKLAWDGYTASQKVIPEIHMWVRGLQSRSDEILHLYPTQDLVYSYVYMLGSSKCQDELSDILEWLDKIKFQPSKRILCALILFSREGKALLKLGAKVAGEWPTPEEYEAYCREIDPYT